MPEDTGTRRGERPDPVGRSLLPAGAVSGLRSCCGPECKRWNDKCCLSPGQLTGHYCLLALCQKKMSNTWQQQLFLLGWAPCHRRRHLLIHEGGTQAICMSDHSESSTREALHFMLTIRWRRWREPAWERQVLGAGHSPANRPCLCPVTLSL